MCGRAAHRPQSSSETLSLARHSSAIRPAKVLFPAHTPPVTPTTYGGAILGVWARHGKREPAEQPCNGP